MNYIIRIIDSEGEVIFSGSGKQCFPKRPADVRPTQSELDQLVALHGGSYADISRKD